MNRHLHKGIRLAGLVGALMAAMPAMAVSINLKTKASPVFLRRASDDASSGDLRIEQAKNGEWSVIRTLKAKSTQAVKLEADTHYKLSFDIASMKRTIKCLLAPVNQQDTALTLSASKLSGTISVTQVTKGQNAFKVKGDWIEMND